MAFIASFCRKSPTLLNTAGAKIVQQDACTYLVANGCLYLMRMKNVTMCPQIKSYIRVCDGMGGGAHVPGVEHIICAQMQLQGI